MKHAKRHMAEKLKKKLESKSFLVLVETRNKPFECKAHSRLHTRACLHLNPSDDEIRLGNSGLDSIMALPRFARAFVGKSRPSSSIVVRCRAVADSVCQSAQRPGRLGGESFDLLVAITCLRFFVPARLQIHHHCRRQMFDPLAINHTHDRVALAAQCHCGRHASPRLFTSTRHRRLVLQGGSRWAGGRQTKPQPAAHVSVTMHDLACRVIIIA